MVDKTSSDSKTFLTDEIFSHIAPIKKVLIEIDLSESISMVFLKDFILSWDVKLKLLITLSNFMKTENQNNAR